MLPGEHLKGSKDLAVFLGMKYQTC